MPDSTALLNLDEPNAIIQDQQQWIMSDVGARLCHLLIETWSRNKVMVTIYRSTGLVTSA